MLIQRDRIEPSSACLLQNSPIRQVSSYSFFAFILQIHFPILSHGLSLLDSHYFLIRHFMSIIILTDFIDPTEAGFAIRLEDQCKKFAEEVVKLLTFMRIHLAFCTSVITVIHAAGAYLAPFCLFILTATGAFVIHILATCATI